MMISHFLKWDIFFKGRNMEKGYFYFISDEYFEKYQDENLMINKETIHGETHNRPCYYSFQDDINKSIFWMIPVSSQIDKFVNEYNKSLKRYGKCDTLSFGYLKGEKNAFLLQNMCPVTEKYILNQYIYVDSQKPVHIPNDLKRELNAKARKIIRLARKGKKLTFTNILKIYQELNSELEQEEL